MKTAFKTRRQGRDSARELARLLKGLAGKKAARPASRSGGFPAKTDPRQKCVAKMQYSSSAAAHRTQLEQYLVREGTDRDGSRSKLFGADIAEYREHMAAKNFRIFLSPQNPAADLKALAESFVKRLELQTGYRLWWQAACHYNTAHPHAHLLINGTDKKGRDVVFPKDIVKTFMRETARGILTSQLGMRTKKDMELEREAELSAPRFTPLDRQLKTLCAGALRVNLAGVPGRGRILARLEALRAMKLCQWKDGAYCLSPRWEEDLAAGGRYTAFLQSRASLRWAPPQALRLYDGAAGKITGQATKVWRADDGGGHAVLLETLDGKAYFVPLFKPPEARDGDTKTPIREGDFISVKAYESQKGRLTPVIFKTAQKALRRETAQNGYTGPLAQALMSGRALNGQEVRRTQGQAF